MDVDRESSVAEVIKRELQLMSPAVRSSRALANQLLVSATGETRFWITFGAGATEGHHNRDHERPHAERRTRLRS
ncbi:hypothetical protein ACFRMR_43995, partial [Streptomyces sp. NPDC056817]